MDQFSIAISLDALIELILLVLALPLYIWVLIALPKKNQASIRRDLASRGHQTLDNERFLIEKQGFITGRLIYRGDISSFRLLLKKVMADDKKRYWQLFYIVRRGEKSGSWCIVSPEQLQQLVAASNSKDKEFLVELVGPNPTYAPSETAAKDLCPT